MSDTPIVDALYARLPSTMDTAGDAKAMQEMGAVARDLERLCGELAEQLNRSTPLLPKWLDRLIANNERAAAKYQSMKATAK